METAEIRTTQESFSVEITYKDNAHHLPLHEGYLLFASNLVRKAKQSTKRTMWKY
jgi:hypothetical protein